MIHPTHLEHPLEILRARAREVAYAPGYQRLHETSDEQMLAEACQIAQEAEAVVVFLGLTELAESEGFDRPHMRLPKNQDALMERLAAVRDDLIVVLFGGSPVEMPWIDQVKAVLNMYLPGQAGGSAVADLLLGKVNPSGKLAEMYPLRYEDTASARFFPGSRHSVEYRESIFVGYRYFDTAQQNVLFPFGHGLSYTSFAYQDLTLSTSEMSEDEILKVSVNITNTGQRAGAEIVQLYVRDVVSSVFKAEKELKGFHKVFLQPGESRTLDFSLSKRDFAHYDATKQAWIVESGTFEILVGASSRDLRLRESVILHSNIQAQPAQSDVLAEYSDLARNQGNISARAFAELYGSIYEQMTGAPTRPYTLNATFNDIQGTLIGKLLRKTIVGAALKSVADDTPERQLVARKMIEETIIHMPLRGLATSSGGRLTLGMVKGFVMLANGQWFRGVRQVLRSLPRKKPAASP